MKILVLTSDIPSLKREAVHRVSFELLKYFRSCGHEIALQVILSYRADTYFTVAQDEDLRQLKDLGVELLPIIQSSEHPALKKRSPDRPRTPFEKLRNAVALPLREVYPWVDLAEEMKQRIATTRPDVLFIFWSPEGLAAVHAIDSVPKYLYYGEPDHKSFASRLLFAPLFNIPSRGPLNQLKLWRARQFLKKKERMHLQMVQRCDEVKNICFYNAEAYRAGGVKSAQYLQNVWPDQLQGQTRSQTSFGARPFQILGSLGNIGTTGNTFAFYYMGEHLLPALRRRFAAQDFQINIYGGGRLNPYIANKLEDPHVKLHGWIEDIDQAVLDNDVFLVLNNAFIAERIFEVDGRRWRLGGAHTRFLHAWALGSCVVAHAANKEAMPELVHNENCLLGKDADELAGFLEQAYRDPALRERLGRQGRQMLMDKFTPEVVGSKILAQMSSLAGVKA